MHSPIKPRKKSCSPPKARIGNKVDAHPGINLSVKILMYKTHNAAIRVRTDINMPIKDVNLKGK